MSLDSEDQELPDCSSSIHRMSLDSEDRELPDCSSSIHSKKHSKISYSREFLLSLGELEICQKLPSGLDQSILSDLEGTSLLTSDRQRVPGGLPSQGFRRNDFGSSPPTRGVYGRWENRFSGRSDQESDAQSVWDSESGRRLGNQPRRSWQSSEQDGLLGSGSFPRPSLYASSGTSAPKSRGNDHCQLNKSNEPYHPPRPYKAGPQSRRDGSDSFNNETFGSVDCASEDRVEEEKRRRASFELMRKEQHKAALPKKQMLNLDKTECVSDSFMSALPEDVKEENRLYGRKELDAPTTLPDTDNDPGKSSLLSQGSSSRPLIPPGFRSTLLEKDSGHKALIHPSLKQAGKPGTMESLLHSAVDPLSSQELCPIDQQLDDKGINVPLLKKGNQIDVSNKKDCMDENLHHPSSILDTHKLMENPEIIGFGAEFSREKFEGESNLNQSASILDNFFGSSVSMAVDEPENQNKNPDDTRSSRNILSSKFAHWFSEEAETKGKDDSSSSPNDLLALIAGGDNNISQVCDAKLEVCESQCACSKDDPIPAVLTCEDLEQTILSEYTENSSNLPSVLPGLSTSSKPEEQRESVDDLASQHLLSLLQKGPDLGTAIPSSNAVKFAEDEKSVEEESQTLSNAITLETLFGTAFMKELQSMQAPISIQSGPDAGLESSQRSSLQVPNDGFFPSTVDDVGGSRSMSNDNSVLVDREQTKRDKTGKLLGFDDSMSELKSKHQTDWSYKNSNFDGLLGLQLPEGESLFSGGNPSAPGEVGEIRIQRTTAGQRGLPFLHGSRDPLEHEMFPGLPAQPSSSLFHPMQMSQGRSLIHPFETLTGHSNSQMNFMGSDIMKNHMDAPTSHQFSGNMMRPPFPVTGFDLPTQQTMLHQQMQIPSNYPRMLQHDRLRSAPVPHPGNHPAAGAFLQEQNPMQAFGPPRQARQPNINGFGIPMPADINRGSNQPEAIQRLLEMEARGSSKQTHPFAGGNTGQGHEFDMSGLRYR